MNSYAKSFYNENKNMWGLEQNFRDLKIYPLKLIDSDEIEIFYHLFTIPKNSIPDREISRMSFLKFLLIIMQNNINKDGKEVGDSIIKFLKHVLKANKIEFLLGLKDPNIGTLENISIKILIDDKEYTEYDFDAIREIVLEQNGLSIEYVDQYNPDLEEKMMFFSKKNNLEFEDQIVTFSALLGLLINEVGEHCTLYQFKKLFPRLMAIKNYEAYVISFTPTEKVKIESYLFHDAKKDRYSSILINKDEFIEKNDIMKISQTS
jgi:hypothetical protein